MKSHRIPRAAFSLVIFVAVILGVIAPTGVVGAADGASPAITSGDLIPVQPSMLNEDGTLNISSGLNGALDVSGWNVTLDSKRGPVFSPAALPANTWSALTDNGVWGPVLALAVIGNDLYVGGVLLTNLQRRDNGFELHCQIRHPYEHLVCAHRQWLG